MQLNLRFSFYFCLSFFFFCVCFSYLLSLFWEVFSGLIKFNVFMLFLIAFFSGRVGVYSTSLNTLISSRSTFRSSASRFCYKRLIWCVLSCTMMFFTVPSRLLYDAFCTRFQHQVWPSIQCVSSSECEYWQSYWISPILDFLRLQKFRSSHVYFHMILWSFAFYNTYLLNHCIARS